jgi:ComF family protein
VAVGAYYDGPVKELILGLKFNRRSSGASAAADLALRTLPYAWRVDLVTSVPIAPARYRQRGYNQSELIARRVAAQMRLPYYPLLGRASSTHQLGLDRRSRLEQVRGAFYLERACQGRRVLVVDDVITTGATLSEAAGVLDAAGAERIWAVAVARH